MSECACLRRNEDMRVRMKHKSVAKIKELYLSLNQISKIKTFDNLLKIQTLNLAANKIDKSYFEKQLSETNKEKESIRTEKDSLAIQLSKKD